MTAKPLLPQQTVTMKGDAPSRDLIEVIQRIVADLNVIQTELAGSLISLQTSQSASGQTEFNFTGIPAWVNRVIVTGRGLSTTGTSPITLRIGDGAIVSAGYLGAVSQMAAAAVVTVNAFTGCDLQQAVAAASVYRFRAVIERADNNNWVIAGNGAFSSGTTTTNFANELALTGALDRVRVTTLGGTDTFDLGSVNISWE